MPTFSERMGLVQPRSVVQIDTMDEPLRNGLWNCVHDYYLGPLHDRGERLTESNAAFEVVWRDFLKRKISSAPNRYDSRYVLLHDWFTECPWNAAYDLVDFLAGHVRPVGWVEARYFAAACNAILESERSAYRFVSGSLSRITAQHEMDTVQTALTDARNHGLAGVEAHITNSTTLLGKRPTGDYANAIKEAISGVEGLAQHILGEPSATLGDAIGRIDARLNVHPALRKGIAQIYGWTSNEGGIRHGTGESAPSIACEDAVFMVVFCSSLVHLLIQKAERSGLLKA